jgi:hypothetical protein
VRPGRRLEQLIRQLFLSAQEARTDARAGHGRRGPPCWPRSSPTPIRFTSPPRLVQRALFGLLAPVARATGHRALDPGYLRRELPVVDLEPLPADIAATIPGLAGQPTRSTS